MLIFITIFFVLLIIEILYLRYAQFKDIKDKPNHRSAHVVPTTRGGGIIFIPATLLFLIFFHKSDLYDNQHETA